MVCRPVSRTIAALGLVWAVQSPWLPTSEAGGRIEVRRISVQEDGSFFAGIWSSLTGFLDKNGCSIDPNGCVPPPGQIPAKEPKPQKDKEPKDPKN